MERLGNVVQVLGVETGDGDTAIHGHVDVVLLAELVHHVLVEASEGEHANLVGHVLPAVLVAERLQLVDEAGAHVSHAARHVAKVLVPHAGQLGVAEDRIDDASTVDGWVRVDGTSNLLDAAHHDVLLSGAARHDGVAAGALSVQTEVLSEGLEEHDVVGVLLEELERVGISLKISRGESLVSRVEGREELLSLDDLKDLLPLGISWVDTSWVVGTDMEHDKGVVLGSVEILL